MPRPLPELGSDATQVLDELCAEMIDKGFHIPSANYFGLMNPTPTYMAVLAEALVSALESAAWFAGALAVCQHPGGGNRRLDRLAFWLAQDHRSRDSAPRRTRMLCDGTFTSGGNEANFTALALAISHHFPNAIEDGIATIGGASRASMLRRSRITRWRNRPGLLGLGRKALRRIPVNDNLRLDTARLILQIEADYACGFIPFCIVATAGTTSSGAIDDLNALASIAERYGLWLHVDGAYGAAAAFSDRYRSLLGGIERADSITIDPHKWLSMPFAAGVILTRHPAMLEKAFSVASPYMPRVARPSMIDNFRVSAQWSRRMNSLKLWLTLRVHGRQAYGEMIERQMELAAGMRAWFERSEYFEPTAPQTLPILNFRLRQVGEEDAETAHRKFIEEFNRDGRYWISRTRVRGKSVLRMMIISYLSTAEHVAGLQKALQSAAERVALEAVR